MTVAAVKFEETTTPYHFACNISGLTRGEIVEVETKNAKRKATFLGYTEPEMIGFMPKKKVLGRCASINENTGKIIAVKNSRRTEQERLTDAANLKKLLQESHPTMLSTNDIAKSLNWGLDQVSGYIKISMKLEPKIVQVYKGWYTSKL